MKKYQMLFPCKMQLSEMNDMGDGTFFCTSCATHVTDVRNNRVPIQNIKCGIFNAKDVVYNSLNVSVPFHQVVRIAMLALVGTTSLYDNNLRAQDKYDVVKDDEKLSILKLPVSIKGRVLGEDNTPLAFATITLCKDGQKSTIVTATDFEGNFNLSIGEQDIENGNISFIISRDGYLSDTLSTEAKPSGFLKIKLTPDYKIMTDVFVVGGISPNRIIPKPPKKKRKQ